MPCDSSYLEPTAKEREVRRAAQLLIYMDEQRGLPSPHWIREAANAQYPVSDRIVPVLCAEIRSLSEEERERLVYNAHDPRSRELADWWEAHQEADQRRVAEESRREAALAKLTEEDRRVLGLL